MSKRVEAGPTARGQKGLRKKPGGAGVFLDRHGQNAPPKGSVFRTAEAMRGNRCGFSRPVRVHRSTRTPQLHKINDDAITLAVPARARKAPTHRSAALSSKAPENAVGGASGDGSSTLGEAHICLETTERPTNLTLCESALPGGTDAGSGGVRAASPATGRQAFVQTCQELSKSLQIRRC